MRIGESMKMNSLIINSIIGENTTFRGELNIDGLLRIDGNFEGSIKTDSRVLVGKSGRALCTIEADTVVIGGMVKGDIKAFSKVILLSTSVFIGNVCSPKIIVEDGGLIHGYCTVSEDENVRSKAPAANNKLFSVDWGQSAHVSA